MLQKGRELFRITAELFSPKHSAWIAWKEVIVTES
jgi:hypothetical protein